MVGWGLFSCRQLHGHGDRAGLVIVTIPATSRRSAPTVVKIRTVVPLRGTTENSGQDDRGWACPAALTV